MHSAPVSLTALDGEFVKDAKDARGNSVGYSHEMTQALRRTRREGRLRGKLAQDPR